MSQVGYSVKTGLVVWLLHSRSQSAGVKLPKSHWAEVKVCPGAQARTEPRVGSSVRVKGLQD